MKILLLLSLILGTLVQASSIEVNFLKKKITSKTCLSNKFSYLACLEAISSIYQAKKGLRLLPPGYAWTSHIAIFDLSVEKKENIEGLELLFVNPRARNGQMTKSLIDFPKLQFLENQTAWFKHFNSTVAKPRIENLLANAISGMGSSEIKEIGLKALTVFARLSLRDGHASYISMGLDQEERTEKPIAGKPVAGKPVAGIPVGGIGISYFQEEGGIRLREVIKGTPADASGLRAGDLIIEVDGRDVGTAGGAERLGLSILGPIGEGVTLKLLRGTDARVISLKREIYDVSNVEQELMDGGQKKIGFIRLRSFLDNSACVQVKEAVLSLREAGAESLVLDLRENSGGDVRQATCIAGIFLDTNKVFYKYLALGSDGSSDMLATSPDPVFDGAEDIGEKRFPVKEPLVILINESSASASELLAGGLRDNHRALIVGEKSFGKGCGQLGEQIEGTPLFLSQTKYYFLRLNGSSVQRVGITPDIEVKSGATFKYREGNLVPLSLPALKPGKMDTYPGIAAIKLCSQGDFEGEPQKSAALRVAACML